MTKEEYITQLRALEVEFNNKKKALGKEFALSNNQIKIGDIVTDHIGSIKVKEIKWTYQTSKEYTCCVYYGFELKKDLTPKKNGAVRGVYQSNLINS